MERFRLTVLQIMWFLVLTFGGSAFALFYFLHNLNKVWHEYPWYKLLYMIPWEALMGGVESMLVFFGSMVFALALDTFLGWRYKRWIMWKFEHADKLTEKKLEMLLNRGAITDKQAEILWDALTRGVGAVLKRVSAEDQSKIIDAFPGKDIDFR